MVREGGADERPRLLVLTLLVGVVLLGWMLLMPQGSQPDEHSHLVRSAALVRGSDGDGAYTLPDRYRVAEPGCYAFDPRQPVTCAEIPVHRDRDVYLITRADGYPPGGHAVFGLASLLPGLAPVWWARIAATVVAAVLVGATIGAALAHRRLLAAAVLLGLTPMAWSIMTAVNPSAFATAGAAALWVGALGAAGTATASGAARNGWLLTAGWVALVLPRRDGLVWACLIVAVVALVEGTGLTDLARRLGRVRVGVIGATVVVTSAWALTATATVSKLAIAAPLALVAAEVAGRWWRAHGADPVRRAVTAAGVAAVGTVAWLGALAFRPGGWDTDLFITVVAQTDENLVEAIGVLGWLDTPVPWLAVFGWLVLLGMLAAVAVLDGRGLDAVGLVTLTAVTSWTFELYQGNETGTYWQGRYSLPLLIGIPLLLARRADGRSDRLVGPVAIGALIVVNVGAWAAARRFGVGHLGSYLPWRWDTPLQPVPPILLLAVIAGGSIGLAGLVVGWRQRPG